MFKTGIWDYWADKYENLWVQKYSLGPTREAVINALLPVLDKDKKYKILDMGCGTGQLLREMQSIFKGFDIEYTGVDISHKMIEICKQNDENATYMVSSIEDFKASKEKYDIIICSHSFPYYSDKLKAMEKFHRWLKKGGLLILAQASANNLYDSFVMFFVKFTTSKAEYLSVPRIENLVKNRFRELEVVKIKERFYMPDIYMFLLSKEDNS